MQRTIGTGVTNPLTPADPTKYGIVTGAPIAGPFELRVLAQFPASATGLVNTFAFCMQAGGNQLIPAVTTTGYVSSNAAGTLTSLTLTGGLADRPIWFTIRGQNGINSGNTTATCALELWAGPFLVWTGVSSTPWAGFSAGTEGLFRIGRLVGGTLTGVRVASIYWRAGLNQAPPSYTFRSLNGTVGP
jgi:hypothetical protein